MGNLDAWRIAGELAVFACALAGASIEAYILGYKAGLRAAKAEHRRLAEQLERAARDGRVMQ